jgi:hypothetical protein
MNNTKNGQTKTATIAGGRFETIANPMFVERE